MFVALDTCSTETYITEELASRLGLQTTATNITISGIGGETNRLQLGKAQLTIKSKVNDWCQDTTVFILDRICENLKYHDTKEPTEIEIDMLLSCQVSLKLLITYDEEAEVLETHLGQCYLPEDKMTIMKRKLI